MNKKILITGGCGFVGSSLSISIKEKYKGYEVIAFDNLKRRGSELNINRLKDRGVHFVHGDIRNSEDIEIIEDISLIIDASAEPSVLAGTNGLIDYLVHTNFNGTINCLKLALKYKADFIFLSTSRIYPINQIEKIHLEEGTTRYQINARQSLSGVSLKGISEEFPLDGCRSLYGATKLASELMINEFNAMGLKTVINRCGVISGPWQMGKVDQGFIVLWLARHFWKKKISYIGFGGEGKQVRDILHIEDLFDLVDYQIHNMDVLNGANFNVGGGPEISVSLQELTELCREITGNKISIDKVAETRINDIRLYVSDNSKIKKFTNWKPHRNLEKILKDTYFWIAQNADSLENILNT